MFLFRHADHHHLSDRELLIHILANQSIIMSDLTKLQAAVSANTAAVDAAVKVISGAADQAAIDAVTAQLETNTAALVAATTPPVPAGPPA